MAGELHRALERAGASIFELGGSGRTDAGVHALAQTAHLRLRRAMDPEALRDAVNEALPWDIHVLGLRPAQATFHARHSAVSRSYLYQIARRRTALAKPYVWWVKRPLDEARIAAAASRVVGRHDLARFCERPQEQASTLVEVETVELASAGDLLLVRLVASHFLWKMARRLVGAFVRVGTGELDNERFVELLRGGRGAGSEPGPAQWTAPPSGLFLERVLYPGEPALAPLAPVTPVARASGASGLFAGGDSPGGRGGRRKAPRGH